MGALLTIAPPLSGAPLLGAMIVFVAVLLLALLLVGLRRRLCQGSWAFPPPLCDCSWALRCLSVCRSRWRPCSVRCHSWLLCCLLLCCPRGPAIAYALTRGCSSAPCVKARGRFIAYRSAAPGRPLLHALYVLVVVLPCALLCCSRWSDVADAWVRANSSSLGATARGRFAACDSAAFGRSSAPCVNVAVWPPALLRLRLRYRIYMGLWLLLCLLSAGSWALRCRCGFSLVLWAPLRPSCDCP